MQCLSCINKYISVHNITFCILIDFSSNENKQGLCGHSLLTLFVSVQKLDNILYLSVELPHVCCRNNSVSLHSCLQMNDIVLGFTGWQLEAVCNSFNFVWIYQEHFYIISIPSIMQQ
jgi:hypothetical protein